MQKKQAELRVGLDLRPTEGGFKAHAGRGTGRYATEVVRHLHLLVEAETSPTTTFFPIFSSALLRTAWEERAIKFMPFGRRTFESQVLYPNRLARLEVDLIHFFAHGDAPARHSIPQVITVLDLIPLRFPELYKASKSNLRFKFARFLEYEAIRRSLGIFAISEATKRDVIDLLGVPEEKIIVTPLAVSEIFEPRDLLEESWQKTIFRRRKELRLPLDKHVLLYVGGIDPRKNIVFLIRAFHALLEGLPKSQRPVLVLAGNYEKDDQFPKVVAEIRDLGLVEDVKLLGFVPDEVLPMLYHAADVFVFPSLYEGFGLPVLEAMACGVPVVAGNNSSIPEVSGEAARLVADGDVGAWVRALKELLSSPQEQRMRAMEGIKRAQQFSWARTALQTYEGYKRFAAGLEQTRTALPTDKRLGNG